MANYDSPIYQIDREGTVLKRFINSLSISGLAWDSWSASGPYLWSWSQDGSNGHLATQIDPKDGHLTGFAFEAALIRANDKETAGVAGGATILPTHGSLRDMPTGLTAMPARLIFVGLQQLSSDSIAHYNLDAASSGSEWVKAVPDRGRIPPNSTFDIQVVFDSTSFYQTGDYYAELDFFAQSDQQGLSPLYKSIPLAMQVECPTCATLNGSVTAAHTGHPLLANIRVTGPNDFDLSVTDDKYALSVPPGTYNITVNANGYLRQTSTLNATRDVISATNFVLVPLILGTPAPHTEREEPPTPEGQNLSVGEAITRTLTLTDSATLVFNLALSDLLASLPNCDTFSEEELQNATPISDTLDAAAQLTLNLTLDQIAISENGIVAELKNAKKVCIKNSDSPL